MRRSLLAAATVLLIAGPALPALAANDAPRVIALAGHGEVRVAPDMAVVNVGVVSQAATAAEALAANTLAMQQVLATLYHTVGLGEDPSINDISGRRLPVLDPGIRPISELI